jgi:hypothetical protein
MKIRRGKIHEQGRKQTKQIKKRERTRPRDRKKTDDYNDIETKITPK